MNRTTTLYLTTGLLTVVILATCIVAWLQGLRGSFGLSELFPVLGLSAYSLMWLHYVSGSFKRYFGLASTDALKRYFTVTSYIVLGLILLHPALFYSGLFQNGLGLPPFSSFKAYTDAATRAGVVMGVVALTSFLLFELKRWFSARSWWKYVEYLSVVAMGLIFMHGLILGGELVSGWFRLAWILFGWVLALSIIYNYQYDKKAKPADTVA